MRCTILAKYAKRGQEHQGEGYWPGNQVISNKTKEGSVGLPANASEHTATDGLKTE